MCGDIYIEVVHPTLLFLKKEDEIYSPTSRYNQTMKRENQEEILGRHKLLMVSKLDGLKVTD